MANETDIVKEALSTLYEETQDFLHVPFEISQVDKNETASLDWPFIFYKNYVSKNKPLLIKNGGTEFPAFGKWSSDYFRRVLSDKEVIVAVTPNGYADGIAHPPDPSDLTEYFALPEEKTMKMNEFLNHLENPVENYVCYIQRQNSNLNDFTELLEDIGNGFLWAYEAFGNAADNINFWMGDQRAVTSMHKDPYENIYCVINGYKDFIIIPPTDLPFVPYKNYPVAKYDNVSPNSYELKPQVECGQPSFINWIPVDPLNERSVELRPEFRKARKYKVRVEKGDVLYLPSLWFHHVTQSHGCIAINFWYDMEFDVKYCYYKMLEKLCKK